MADQLGVPHDRRADHGRLHSQGLAKRPRDAEPDVRTVDRHLGARQDLRHVVPVAPDRHRAAKIRLAHDRLEGRSLSRAGSDEEEAGVGPAGVDTREGAKHVVVPLGLADADLRDERGGRVEAELGADCGAIHPRGVEPIGVGAGVDDLDLFRRDPLADEVGFDGHADSHHDGDEERRPNERLYRPREPKDCEPPTSQPRQKKAVAPAARMLSCTPGRERKGEDEHP